MERGHLHDVYPKSLWQIFLIANVVVSNKFLEGSIVGPKMKT